MKKFLSVLIFLFVLCLAVSCMPADNGGDKTGGAHEHTLGDWVLEDDEAESCEGATFVAKCSECSETVSREGTDEDHLWNDLYNSDESDHWKTCRICQQKKSSAHTYDNPCDAFCNDCGRVRLDYHEDLNHDGKCDVVGCGAGVKVSHVDIGNDNRCDVCGCVIVCEHTDENRDALCDLCAKPIPNTIPLVNSRGESGFKFVLGSGITVNVYKKIDNLQRELLSLGVAVDYNEGNECEYEILFGEVSGRGTKYNVNIRDYGTKGYVVKIIDKKIVVLGGSEAAFLDAIDKLREDFFGITEAVTSSGTLKDVYLYSDKISYYVQNDYPITLITLFGSDIRGFKIGHNTSSAGSAATKLQALIYEKTGYWLEVIRTDDPSDNTIFLGEIDNCGDTGFSASFSENGIVFLSEYSTTLGRIPYEFFAEAIAEASSAGEILVLDKSDESYAKFAKNAHYVYYDDFGAVGDGVTNDADAIYEAHSYAVNGGHKKIIGTPGKTYLIGEIASKSASIITCDVDWTDVKFIIDDREATITNGYRGSVFEVRGSVSYGFGPSKSEFLQALNDAGGFKASEITKFDLGIGHAAMLAVSNDTHKYFIRQGVNANSGNTQRELILVDEYGNIDPKAGFLFNYEKVTYVTVYRVDAESSAPITINGGEFTTKAHDQTEKVEYTGQRGITVYRHNTTIKNLEHYVTGEPTGDKGSAYPNFMDINKAYNVLIEDCVFTARKAYYTYKGTSKVGQGTYDITTHDSLEVVWRRCTESNFYNSAGKKSYGYWGINGGGGSKRITYDGCTLSRFDAHTGIMHAYIYDSIVGSVDVVGGGNLHIINSEIYGTSMIRFREDYGAFWYGDVIIKDCTMVDQKGTATTGQLFEVSWVNHYYGYETAMPASIIIDGLKVKGEPGITTKVVNMNIFANSFINNSDKYNAPTVDGAENVNIMTPPGSIIVRNNRAGFVFNLSIFEGKEYFKNTHVEEIPVGTIPSCSSHTDHNGDYTCDTCWEYIRAN